MAAKGVQHAHSQGRVGVKAGVGLAQLTEHLGREAVVFGRAVDADQQQRALHFAVDAAFGMRLREARRARGLYLRRQIRVCEGVH